MTGVVLPVVLLLMAMQMHLASCHFQSRIETPLVESEIDLKFRTNI